MSGFSLCSLTWASRTRNIRFAAISLRDKLTPFGRETASLSSRPGQLANEKSHPTWMAFVCSLTWARTRDLVINSHSL